MLLLFRILIGLGLLSVCGCNLNYYWHLARGQSRVVYNRIPVQTLLAQPNLAEQTRTQLELIQAILRYAESVGLKTDDQYTTFYDTGGDPISWNVSASPPDRFSPYTWDFPFIGEVPYKGFFHRDLADEQRDALAAEGYDAIVRPVSAYSTLGFFSDPILSPMLGYAPDQLADLILHELTHALVYAPGQTDYNESLATFVGRQGSLLFLAQHFGTDTPLLQQAEARRADAALFRKFMAETVAALDSLYSLGLPRNIVLRDRQVVFAQRQRDFTLIKNAVYPQSIRWIPPVGTKQRTSLVLSSLQRQFNALFRGLSRTRRGFGQAPWRFLQTALKTATLGSVYASRQRLRRRWTVTKLVDLGVRKPTRNPS